MSSVLVRLGIVGAGARGESLARLVAAMPPGLVSVTALCDSNLDALAVAAASYPHARRHVDYEEMLAAGDVDAVLIATPMQLHAGMSIAALRHDVAVLCEVPAAVNTSEARALVEAADASSACYAMAENYLFSRNNRVVREIARAGFFGTPTFGRGEYLHELRRLNEETPWRRVWQTGIRGVTYPTHSLGPVLEWMGWPRVSSVACAGTGSHYTDARGEHYHDDSATMLCEIEGGAQAEVRVDMISDRPHAMENYEFQGTDGVYESGRGAADDHGRIWLRALDVEPRWRDLDEAYAELRERYPERVPAVEDAPPGVGHGGGDFFTFRDFLTAVSGDREPVVGIHRAMDLTLPGIASQEAIVHGRWVAVPNSRSWLSSEERSVVQMLWPEGHVPEAPELPDGYELGQLRRDERDEYVALMHRAGFSDWTRERFAWVDKAVLPDGHFVVRRRAANGERRIVATALAAHRPSELHPAGGELGWVAADPDERGRGLGRVVCAAVVRRFIAAGYHRIYLITNTFRIPALAVYLRMGFVPFIRDEGDRARWDDVFATLGFGEG